MSHNPTSGCGIVSLYCYDLSMFNIQDDVYRSVIADVVVNLREMFLDENVDVEVLHALKKARCLCRILVAITSCFIGVGRKAEQNGSCKFGQCQQSAATSNTKCICCAKFIALRYASGAVADCTTCAATSCRSIRLDIGHDTSRYTRRSSCTFAIYQRLIEGKQRLHYMPVNCSHHSSHI